MSRDVCAQEPAVCVDEGSGKREDMVEDGREEERGRGMERSETSSLQKEKQAAAAAAATAAADDDDDDDVDDVDDGDAVDQLPQSVISSPDSQAHYKVTTYG